MRLAIVYLLFICSFQASGQCNKSLVGHWQMIAAFNGEVYFNLKTDSTFISSEIKEMYPDTASQNRMIALAKDIYSATNFKFDKNGIYRMFLDTTFQIEGRYCYKVKDNILQLTSKNSLGKDITENTISRLENGLLYISKKQEDSEQTLDLILERRL